MPRRKRVITLTPEEIQSKIDELDKQITELNAEIKGLKAEKKQQLKDLKVAQKRAAEEKEQKELKEVLALIKEKGLTAEELKELIQ